MAERRRRFPLLATIVAAVAIAAATLAPARLAGPDLTRATRGAIRMLDADGTIWRARATLAAGAARLPVAWRLDAWPLLRGELRLAIGPDPGAAASAVQAQVAIAGDRVSLRDVHATLPAGWLIAAAGVDPAWDAGGELDVSAAAVEWAPPANRGAAKLVWQRARIVAAGFTRPLDLGEVALALTADRDSVSGPVSNAGGDLAIRGDVRLRVADGLRISLLLTPRRGDDVELARALAALGAPEGAGWRIERRFSLR